MHSEPGLTHLADEAAQRGYAQYAEFCRLREKSLRRESQEKLVAFIAWMQSQPAECQRAFADWILTFSFQNPSVIDALPTVLRRDLVAPIISAWTRDEPDKPQALRWSDDERALLVAARVHPPDEIAIGRYAASVINRIDFATHDPDLYLSNEASSDMAALQTVLDLLNRVHNADFFESNREEALLLKLQLASTQKRADR
jgi:hypothetical protein